MSEDAARAEGDGPFETELGKRMRAWAAQPDCDSRVAADVLARADAFDEQVRRCFEGDGVGEVELKRLLGTWVRARQAWDAVRRLEVRVEDQL